MALVKSVELKILATDGEAQAKLDEISAKAEELRRLNPTIKPKIDTAEAAAKLAVLRREIRAAASDAGSSQGGFFGLARSIGSVAGMIGGNVGAAGIPGAGAVMGAGPEGLAGAVATAAPLIASLASVAIGAGAGLGVFGLAAMSSFKQLNAAIGTTKAAKKAFEALTPGEQAAARELQGMKNDWQGFVRSVQPQVFSVFRQGFGIVRQVIGELRPILNAAMPGIHALVGVLGGTLVKALQVITPMVRPSMGVLVQLTGALSGAFLQLVKSLAANMPAWIELTKAFIGVIPLITKLIPLAVGLIGIWARLQAVVVTLATTLLGPVVHALQGAGRWVTQLGTRIDPLVHKFMAAPGRILSGLSSLPGRLFQLGIHAIQGMINGVTSMGGSLLQAGWNLADSFVHTIMGHLGIHSPSTVMHGIGLNLGQGLINGLDASRARVSSMAGQMAAAAVAYPASTRAGGGGNGALTIQLEWTGGNADSEFMSFLAKNIRVRGGSPDILSRKVQFA